MDVGKLPAKVCICGNKITGTDIHAVCSMCLGLQHAQDKMASRVAYEHFARLSIKTCRRRLVHQASQSMVDPMVGVAIPLPQELEESAQGNTIPTGASWGDQLDTVTPLTDLDEHHVCLMAEHVDVE